MSLMVRKDACASRFAGGGCAAFVSSLALDSFLYRETRMTEFIENGRVLLVGTAKSEWQKSFIDKTYRTYMSYLLNEKKCCAKECLSRFR